MNNTTFGVSMPHAGSGRALHVVTATTAPALAALAAFATHAAAAPAAAGIAPQRKRRTAAATDASVNGGTT
jgi:hypothetical protein